MNELIPKQEDRSYKVWQDQLAFYAAQTLPEAERTALERHLDTCSDCQMLLSVWCS